MPDEKPDKVMTLILGWPVPYQLGLAAILVVAVIYVILVQGHLRQQEETATAATTTAAPGPTLPLASEPPWMPSPIVTEFTAVERRWAVAAGPSGTEDVHEIKLMKAGVDVGTFTAIKLYEGGYWKTGEATDLYIKDRAKAPLAEYIRGERFRSLLQRADEILCIGLASADGADRRRNEDLSLRRANRLRDLVLSTGNFNALKVTAVPFGQAMGPVPTDPLIEQGQRAAVIIGVGPRDRTIADAVIYDEVLKRVRLSNTDLRNYSRVVALAGGALASPAQK